jgi:predicted RNase H-like HicB family nuclease
MKTYTAVCERDERGTWVITVQELRGVVTQSRRLDKARDLAADAIALWLDTNPDTFEVRLDVRFPDDAVIKAAIAKRQQAEASQREAAAALQAAAVMLTGPLHFTMRDASVVLGVSHQRVQQVLADHVITPWGPQPAKTAKAGKPGRGHRAGGGAVAKRSTKDTGAASARATAKRGQSVGQKTRSEVKPRRAKVR